MSRVSTQIVPFYSRLNRRELPYCAILPVDYENSNKSFAVLYLLHGLFGRFDNWITNTDLINYARDFSFIIVCAEGGDSWYTDNKEMENHFYESCLVKELIPDVERRFKARPEKNSRAVAGLSMGGYGAFKLAFRHPEMFCLAASMSGAFHAAEIYDGLKFNRWRELQPSILKVFGSENLEIRRRNSLFQTANNFLSEQIIRLPYFYFDCGTDDSFLSLNLKMAKLFRSKKIAHEFHEFSGGHDWNYWNRQLKRILRIAETHLNV